MFRSPASVIIGAIIIALSWAYISFLHTSSSVDIELPEVAGIEFSPPRLPPGVVAKYAYENARVNLDVDAPRSTYIGDVVVVKLVGTLRDVTEKSHANFLFQLSGAGLQIAPQDWLTLRLEGHRKSQPVSWTVRADKNGTYRLLFNGKFDSSLTARNIVQPDISYPADLTLKVRSRFSDYFVRYWPYLTSVMGTFLTLPGILAYLKGRKAPPPSDPQK
jgi:hypothetical protein